MLRRVSARFAPTVVATLAAVGIAFPFVARTTSFDITGTYKLATINARPLPFVMQADEGDSVIMLQGTAVFTPSGYVMSATHRTVVSGTADTSTVADSGTYTLSGAHLTLTPNDDSDPLEATVSAGTITIQDVATADGDSTFTFVFRKQ